MVKQFLRSDTFRYKRIGSHSRKLSKWRRPRGKHNKLRLKRTGHPASPSIGYGTSGRSIAPLMINNLKDIESVGKNTSVIISKKVGAKKRLEIIKKAEEKSIKILNVRAKK
jgi:large subunit ribosomal protein L32e